MLTKRFLLRVAVASLVAFSANAISAQQIAVQQPIIGVTSVSTSVMVPDRGQVHLGGVSSAQSFRSQNGFGLRGSNLGLSRSSRSVSATVTIIDLHEMDEAILNSAPVAAPNSRPRLITTAGAPRSPADLPPHERAALFERLARRAEEQGKPGVAKLHSAMAAKYRSSADSFE